MSGVSGNVRCRPHEQWFTAADQSPFDAITSLPVPGGEPHNLTCISCSHQAPRAISRQAFHGVTRPTAMARTVKESI